MAQETHIIMGQKSEKVVRSSTVRLLEQAISAAGRVKTRGDEEALHDLRVALRSLRSSLEAYGAVLGKQRKAEKFTKRLGAIMRSTNKARDAEVQVAWLKKHCGAVSNGHDTPEKCFLHMAEKRCERRRAKVLAGIDDTSKWLNRRLQPWLGAEERAVRGKESSFGELFVKVAGKRAKSCVAVLSRAGCGKHAGRVHHARIATKRLRYLLEPLKKQVDGVEPLLDQCRVFQDLLGELNDLIRLEKRVRRAKGRSLVPATTTPAGKDSKANAKPKSKSAKPLAGLLQTIDSRKAALVEELGKLRKERLEDFEGELKLWLEAVAAAQVKPDKSAAA
jgi:CHAD domain-containing protein